MTKPKRKRGQGQPPPAARKLGAAKPKAEAARREQGGGRPRAIIDLATVRNAALIGATADEIAVILGISRASFYARMAEEPAIADAMEDGRATGKTTLRRAQWRAAVGQPGSDRVRAIPGNVTMQIWLGKQMLGQRDKVEHAVDETLEDLLGRLSS